MSVQLEELKEDEERREPDAAPVNEEVPESLQEVELPVEAKPTLLPSAVSDALPSAVMAAPFTANKLMSDLSRFMGIGRGGE